MNKQWYLVMAAALTLAGASFAQTAPKAAQPAAVQQLAAQSVDQWVGQFDSMSKSTDKAQKDGFAALAQAALNAMDTAKANSIASAVNNKVKNVGISKVNGAWTVMFNLTEDGDASSATVADDAQEAMAALTEFANNSAGNGKGEASVDPRLNPKYWEEQGKEPPFNTEGGSEPSPGPVPPHPVSKSSSWK